MDSQKMKHTPGPWGIDEFQPWRFEIVGPSNQSVAKCDFMNTSAPCGKPENKPNARLIAAAPEMLDALKAAFDLIPTEHSAAITMVGNAIRKAERVEEGGNNG
jgi:hypothetical protein